MKPWKYIPFSPRRPDNFLSRRSFLPEVVNPVVIIPGFLGTWPAAFRLGGGKLDPITGIYSNLREGLRSIGYIPGVSLFEFPYDWRLGIEELGLNLGKELEAISRLSSSEAEKKFGVKIDYTKIDLVAHSMGGLVCRSFLLNAGQDLKVNRLVLVATPNQGAVAAYYGYGGGETTYIGFPTHQAISLVGILEARRQKNLFKRGIKTFQAIRGKNELNLQAYFSQETAAIRDLLPLSRTNYLFSRTQGLERIYPYGPSPGYPANSRLEKLASPEGLASLDRVQQIKCLYSSAYLTRARVEVKEANGSSPLYPHGYPVDPQPPGSFTPGDTIVTTESAQIKLEPFKPDGSPWKVRAVNEELNVVLGLNLNHVQLIGEPAPVLYILNYLAGDSREGKIGSENWKGLPLSQRKPNYGRLFY